MNFLYIHTHDTGRCISPYGCNVRTPNYQRVARKAAVFRQAFCAAPTCSPSRAALLTGQYPHAAGMLGLAHRGFALADPTQHLAHFLGRSGYDTVLCGVQHEANNPQDIGYTQTITQGDDMSNAQAAAAFLQNHDGQRPFFLSFGMFATHREFPDSAAQRDANYLSPAPTMADTPATRKDWADFLGSVEHADSCLGVVMEALETAGLAQDTLVLVTTDHGPAFPRMKCHLQDAGIGVLMMLRGPGVPAGVIDAMVSHIDIFPTVCELMGLEKPDYLQGTSMRPLFAGAAGIHKELYAEVTYHAAYEPQRCIRTKRYKYISYYDDDDHDRYVLANIDDSPSKDFLMKHGLYDGPRTRYQLYDLYNDPQERDNLYGNPAYARIQESLQARLRAHMHATNDPLLIAFKGRVPLPAGATANTRDCISPQSKNPVDYE